MKIAWITDMGTSGYRHISIPICKRLVDAGHEVKVLGLGYQGEEHWYPFSVIPCQNYNHMFAMITNFLGDGFSSWDFDVLIVALDIPLQGRIMSIFPDRTFQYWGIFPVEAPPLTRSWADILQGMDRQFIISEFGTEEAQAHGIDATFLPVGVDSVSWRLPEGDEREMLRGSYGLSDDDFTILTVADNQERKFLSRAAQIIREFKVKHSVNLRWILVTRVNLEVGWKLNDLISDLGILNDTILIERGIPFKEFWSLFAMSDCFLLTSKTEGIGLPVLEAMACGLPVVATDATGMGESIRKGGGYAIRPEKLEAPHIDPFGNSYRYFASIEDGVQQLHNVWTDQGVDIQTTNARAYIETLNWDQSARIVEIALEEMNNG